MPKNLDFTKAHETLSLSVSGPFVDQSAEMDCGTYFTIHLDRRDCGTYVAKFELAWDISPLFPYMNAVTVSLDISTASLRESINLKDAHIEHLQRQLADIAKTQGVDFSATNARLPSPLTRREIQVLKMLAQGATNKEISSDLQISEHTVKSHVIHIFNKLGVNDRTLASVWAASQGLL